MKGGAILRLATEADVIGGAWASWEVLKGKPKQCIRVSVVDPEATELKAEAFTGGVGREKEFLASWIPCPSAFLCMTEFI